MKRPDALVGVLLGPDVPFADLERLALRAASAAAGQGNQPACDNRARQRAPHTTRVHGAPSPLLCGTRRGRIYVPGDRLLRGQGQRAWALAEAQLDQQLAERRCGDRLAVDALERDALDAACA